MKRRIRGAFPLYSKCRCAHARAVPRTHLLALAGLVLSLACSEAPGELPPDASADASTPADASPADAEAGADATEPTDAASDDAGLPPDAGTEPCPALQDAATDALRFDALRLCLADGALGAELEDRLIREFIDQVEAAGGFPIRRDASSFIFVYLADPIYDAEDDQRPQEDFHPDRRLAPIRVAFDLTQAASSTLALGTLHPGFHAGELQVLAPAGQRYRFVAKDTQDADWVFSDPLSRRFDFDGNGRYSLVLGQPEQGHLEWVRSVHATQLDNDRPLYLYVPPGYDQQTRRYSVLYMHDGNNLFHPGIPRSAAAGTWNVHFVMQRELQGGHVRPGLIVGIPNNDNRLGEYTHVEDEIGGRFGGDGDAYADFVVNDVKPLVDGRYRTLPDRDDTGVMGSSLGGLISYHIGMRHPETFRFVGGLSSTFIWGKIGLENETMIERYAALTDLLARDQIFYLDSGGGPTPACPEGSDNYCEALLMRDTLVAGGVDRFPLDPDASPLSADTNIMHWWSPNAPHNEGAWFSRVHRSLRLFFRPE